MHIDPKLIEISKCGKYVYPVDSITGHKTFAPIDYFKKTVETRYDGSIEKFVKEYKTRETRKYLGAGFSVEQIKEIASNHKNHKLPKINAKPKKDPNAPKKPRKKRLKAFVESTQTVTNPDGTLDVIKRYPWSDDPQNYFKGTHKPVNIADETRESCLRPDIYLDSECRGCPFYAECICELKIIPKVKK